MIYDNLIFFLLDFNHNNSKSFYLIVFFFKRPIKIIMNTHSYHNYIYFFGYHLIKYHFYDCYTDEIPFKYFVIFISKNNQKLSKSIRFFLFH